MDTLKKIIAPLAVGIIVGAIAMNFVIGSKLSSSEVVGAVASPNIQSPYLTVGGVRHWYGSSNSLLAATSTICSIKSPKATSTLMFASLHINTSAATTTTALISIGATPYATTTALSAIEVATSTRAELVAASLATSTSKISPDNYINFTYYTNGAVNTMTGRCAAEFIEI